MLQAQANARQIKRKLSRGFAALGLVMLGLLFMAGSIAFTLAALWIYLRPEIGPVNASLFVSGLLFILTIGLLAAARVLTNDRHGRHKGKRASEIGPSDVAKTIRTNKPLFLTAALIAGIMAASSSSGRRDP